MQLLYLDESGDNGFAPGSTELFVIAGLSIESTRWKDMFWAIAELKREITRRHGVRINEFKAADIFQHRGEYFGSSITPHDLSLRYSYIVDLVCKPYVAAFAVMERKADFAERQGSSLSSTTLLKLFNEAIWSSLLKRYDQFLYDEARRTGQAKTAMIFSDNNSSQEKHIRAAIRNFSRKHDLSGSPFSGTGVIEDIIFRDSKASPMIQMADVLAFSLGRLFSSKKSHDVFSIPESVKDKLLNKLEGHFIDTQQRSWHEKGL